jgi:hypothetical protein
MAWLCAPGTVGPRTLNAIAIPADLQWMIKKGPGHKRITDDRLIDSIVEWLRALPMAPQDSQQRDAWAC